ncbi:hypothetical protein EDB92DRAFT_1812895 [Lactarius akahatsu]|uniref:Uncharacterized protein n=1 Tax=Lactarius akahatsu TaxID=416441 RepID=A0AAD4LRP3_9AGAM|nr:hypothetical protein EDB92DRAFT_1812895 [Lactarius akahatsu]
MTFPLSRGDRIITATFNVTLHSLAQHISSILPRGKEGSGLRIGRMTVEKWKQGTHAIRNYCRLGTSAPRAFSDLSVGAIWVVPTTCSHLRASLRSLGVWAAEKPRQFFSDVLRGNVLTGGATSVCDDSMPEEFEDNAESVLDMLESTDCIGVGRPKHFRTLVIEEDWLLSFLKENMMSYLLENCVGLGDVFSRIGSRDGEIRESRIQKQKPVGIESVHWGLPGQDIYRTQGVQVHLER